MANCFPSPIKTLEEETLGEIDDQIVLKFYAPDVEFCTGMQIGACVWTSLGSPHCVVATLAPSDARGTVLFFGAA